MRAFRAAALAALLFYAIAVLWVPQRWAWTAFQVSIFALAAAWLIPFILGRERLEASRVLIPLAGAVLWGIAQLAAGRTVYRWVTWTAVLDWTTYLAAAFVALQTFADPRVRHIFLRVVVYFSLALSVLSMVQMFTAAGKIYWLFDSGYADALGPFLSRNQYGAFMELLLPVVVWQALKDRRRALLCWVTASVMFASVVAGASRAGSILTAGEMLILLAIGRARELLSGRELGFAAAKLLLFAALFTAVVGWEALWARLQQPDPYAGRREMLWSSIDMVKERPVWGFGLGTWPTAYPAYAYFDDGTFVNQAHNDWAQWAVEGGLPLFLLMAVLAGMVFGPALRSVWGLGVVSVLVHGVVDYPLQQRPALAAWTFLFAAMVVQADRQRGRV